MPQRSSDESKVPKKTQWATRLRSNRQLWTKVHTTDLIVIVNPTGDHEAEEDDGDDEIVLHLAKPTRWFMLNLSALTEAEIQKMREVLNAALDLAEPVARRRDQLAQQEDAEGDDTRVRLYRPVPTIYTRKRWQQELRGRVQQRSSWASTLGRKEPTNLVEPGSDQ